MDIDKNIEQKLLEMAKIARENAYAPYSNYMVGASLRTEDNKYYSGCNIENSSFSATICAERVAIGSAISECGKINISHLLVYAKDPSPCGICRQVISNFVIQGAIVLLINTSGRTSYITFKELFPLPFIKF